LFFLYFPATLEHTICTCIELSKERSIKFLFLNGAVVSEKCKFTTFPCRYYVNLSGNGGHFGYPIHTNLIKIKSPHLLPIFYWLFLVAKNNR